MIELKSLPPHLQEMVVALAVTNNVTVADVLLEAARDGLNASYQKWKSRK